MKKCPYCSTEIQDNAEFCIYCMQPLNLKNAVEHRIKKPYLKRIVILSLSVFAVVFTVLFCILNFPHKNPITEKPSSSFRGFGSLPDGVSGGVDESENKATENGHSKNETSHGEAKGSDDNGTVAVSTSGGGSKSSDNSTNTKNSNGNNNSSSSRSSVSNSGSASGSDSDKSSSTKTSSAGSQSSESSVTKPSTSSNESESVKPTWSTRTVSGGVEITGISNGNSDGIYSIPSQIDGKTVVGIGTRAFYYEREMQSITLPNTLKYIGDQAFAYCHSLTEIKIPSSVTSIGSNAFLPCNNLSKVYISSKSISISNYAFSDTYNRNVSLTIYAPTSAVNKESAAACWSAKYVEWNG